MAEKKRLFDTGYVIRSASAWNAMRKTGVSEWSLLERHQTGNHGIVGPAQQRSNSRGIAGSGRVFSAYRLLEQHVWVVTDLELRVTFVMTPREYMARARAMRRKQCDKVARSIGATASSTGD
jgi:hypothetical protein